MFSSRYSLIYIALRIVHFVYVCVNYLPQITWCKKCVKTLIAFKFLRVSLYTS